MSLNLRLRLRTVVFDRRRSAPDGPGSSSYGPSFGFTSVKGLTGYWWVGDSAPNDTVIIHVAASITAATQDAAEQNWSIYQDPDATPVDSGGDVVQTKNVVVVGDPRSVGQ